MSPTISKTERRPAGDGGIQEVFTRQTFLPTGIEDRVQIGKISRESLLPLVPSLLLFLGVAHRVSDQFAEANLGMHLADDITQFWVRLQQVINLLDLLQDMEGLFADRFTFWRAGPRASTGILPGGGRKNRSNRRREDATGPFLKTLSRLSITSASAGLVCVAQANRDIDRDDIETSSTVENFEQSAHLPYAPSIRLNDHNGPTARGAVDACDASQ